MAKNQAEKIEIHKRVRIIQKYLCQGWGKRDIITYGVNQWGVCDRQVRRYIDLAFEWFKEDSAGKMESKRAFHNNLRMDLYRELKFKDTPAGASAALGIIKDIAELEGLYTKKVEVTGEGGQPLIPFDPLKVIENKLIISVVTTATADIEPSTDEGIDQP